MYPNCVRVRVQESIPHMAVEYGFQYELVQYKWPRWLHQQREKQRIIWGYKILFLDVLFPLAVDKFLFVDADQVSAHAHSGGPLSGPHTQQGPRQRPRTQRGPTHTAGAPSAGPTHSGCPVSGPRTQQGPRRLAVVLVSRTSVNFRARQTLASG